MARSVGSGLRLLLPALVVFAGGVSSVPAQSPSATTPSDLIFRANVNEVRVTFSATDQNNRVIAALQPSDFAIVDQDLVVREFRSFARADYTQLAVAVLVDASASTTPQFRRELANVAEMVGGLNDSHLNDVPGGNFSLVSFHDLTPIVVCDGNCGTLTAAAPPVFKSGGLTPLYDSLVFASHMLGAHTGSHVRKILIVYSDGLDTISLHSFSDALDAAVEDDVAIYTVDVDRHARSVRGPVTLRSLSASTGGRYFPEDTGTEKVLAAVLEDFHATYTVAYKLPSRAAGFHEVRILSTQNPGLQFHCRHGYYVSNSEN